jgi:hypothetical protein
MPITQNLQVNINQQPLDIGNLSDLALKISWALEDPESFENKQASMSFGVKVPATNNNAKILNTAHDVSVEDMTAGYIFEGELPACSIIVNGVEILTGKAVLKGAGHTRQPEFYELDLYGQNGDWVTEADDYTLWDCLSTTPHNFTVANVISSWSNYGTSETNDYVYAPVRYRQPFAYYTTVVNQENAQGVAQPNIGTLVGNDDTCTVYHLRPSLSIYFILYRFFRALGYSINSNFFNTPYFRGLVLLWTWGDFYDINSNLSNAIGFKAGGNLPTDAPPASGYPTVQFWSGNTSGEELSYGITPGSSIWIGSTDNGLDPFTTEPAPTGGLYVYTSNAVTTNNRFDLNNFIAPVGFNYLGLTSFDDSSGTVIFTYNPPAGISTFANNININFSLQLYCTITGTAGVNACIGIEITHIFASGATTTVNTYNILPSGGNLIGEDQFPTTSSKYPVEPAVYNFTVGPVSIGDTLKFRIRCLAQFGGGATFHVYQAGFFRQDAPNVSGSSPAVWAPAYSFLTMTGFEVALGQAVNFQWYDKFRSYKTMDLLRGLVDLFNLSISTDPIARTVTIEPTHAYALPDGSGTMQNGYYSNNRLDWTAKQDINQINNIQLYGDSERQYDFSFNQDGSDGGSNIWAARYMAIYLNNKKSTPFNSINMSNNDNTVNQGIPGAARYLLPSRFRKGVRTMVNRFFSATMQYLHSSWANIAVNNWGASNPIAPQLPCIIPENVSDTSAGSITDTFEPKIAFYAGLQSPEKVGGWRFVGDPLNPYIDGGTPNSLGFSLPYLFTVDYTGWVAANAASTGVPSPVLTYCDQNVGGSQVKGLFNTFFLKRFAIMRNGKRYMPFMRLNLGDITDWEHQNRIIINGNTYFLTGISNFDPLSDGSCQCTFWKECFPEAIDQQNTFPSTDSIIDYAPILAQFDLRYARVLLYQSDMPQIV